MGLFYTLYYAAMPVIAGACAKWTGSAAAAFDFGALMMLACPLILWGFNRIPALVPKPAWSAPPTTLANSSLTLSAVGSGDTEQPVVGWRRWLWRTKNLFFRPPKSDGAFSG